MAAAQGTSTNNIAQQRLALSDEDQLSEDKAAKQEVPDGVFEMNDEGL